MNCVESGCEETEEINDNGEHTPRSYLAFKPL